MSRILILAAAALLLSLIACEEAPTKEDAQARPAQPQKQAVPQKQTVEAMIGQMLMVGFRGDGEEYLDDLDYVQDLISTGKVGGVILFETEMEHRGVPRNITSPRQLRALTEALQAKAPIPLFIAVDQEGGWVQRLKPKWGFKNWPSAYRMGHMSDQEVKLVGYEMGEELAEAGINLNMAPSLDVNVNPESPAIGGVGRSFSGDPDLVADKGRAYMQGLNAAGVAGCFKHFPGHGSALADTHMGAADVTDTWREYELNPYDELINMPGAYCVMVAHVFHRELSGGRPATLSQEIIGGLLRQKLGWQGVVISDDMQMDAIAMHHKLEEALLLGVQAGMDIFIFGNNMHYDKTIGDKAYAALLALHRSGRISEERIEESYHRIMELKKRISTAHTPVGNMKEQPEKPQAQSP